MGSRHNRDPIVFIGAPGEIRTPDLLIRSQMLYPAELLAQDGALLVPNPPDLVKAKDL